MSKSAQHRKVGAALGIEGAIVHVKVVCSACSTKQTEPVDLKLPVRAQVMQSSCLFCGRFATLKRAS
jgi:hypothetical protein